MDNKPKDQINQVERDLQRMTTLCDQYKKDIDDAELQSEIVMLGSNQLITNYTDLAQNSSCIAVKLICSLVVEDLKITIKVAEAHLNELIK